MSGELRERADAYARVAIANIEREFPHHEGYPQSDASPIPRPRELHPAFYGSLDWHSCVEMHWRKRASTGRQQLPPDALAHGLRSSVPERLG